MLTCLAPAQYNAGAKQSEFLNFSIIH